MDTSLDVLLAEMPALIKTLPCSGELEQEKWDEILAMAADCGSDWLDNLIEAVGQEAFKQSILKQLKATHQLIKQFEAKEKDLEKELKGAEGTLVLADVVIAKYKRGELLPEPLMQTHSTSGSDTPPTEAKKAVSSEPLADSPEEP